VQYVIRAWSIAASLRSNCARREFPPMKYDVPSKLRDHRLISSWLHMPGGSHFSLMGQENYIARLDSFAEFLFPYDVIDIVTLSFCAPPRIANKEKQRRVGRVCHSLGIHSLGIQLGQPVMYTQFLRCRTLRRTSTISSPQQADARFNLLICNPPGNPIRDVIFSSALLTRFLFQTIE